MLSATWQYSDLVYIRRVLKKVKSDEMAKAIGVSKETYLRTERGERELTLAEAMSIANKLSMPIALVFPKIFDQDVVQNATM